MATNHSNTSNLKDEPHLKLLLGADSDFAALTNTLKTFTSVKEVTMEVVYQDFGEPEWHGPDVPAFFETIGRLPKLTSLYLDKLGLGCDSDDSDVPIELLTLLLKESAAKNQLQTLDMNTTYLSTRPEDNPGLEFMSFLGTLKSLKTLKKIHWEDCRFSDIIDLNQIFNALGGLSSLKEVVIISNEEPDVLGNIQVEALEKLCEQCPALQTLQVGPFPFGEGFRLAELDAKTKKIRLKDINEEEEEEEESDD